MAYFRGCHERLLECLLKIGGFQVLVGLTEDIGGDDVSRESSKSSIDGERMATSDILVDLAA